MHALLKETQNKTLLSQSAKTLSTYQSQNAKWYLTLLDSIEGDLIQTSLKQLTDKAIVANPFYEPSILNAAVEHLSNGEVQYLALSKQQGDEEALKFFMPVTLRRIGISRTQVLQSWTHQYAPLGMPLIDEENHNDTLTAFINCIHDAKHDKATAITIEYLAKEGEFINALYNSTELSNELLLANSMSRAGLIPPKNQDYINTHFSGKRKLRLNKAKREIEKLGKLSFNSFSDKQKTQQPLETFLKIEASGWKGHKKTAFKSSQADTAFCTKAVTEMVEKGQCTIHTLDLNNETIASLICFNSKGYFYPWKIAFNEAYAKFSVGNLLVTHATTQIANNKNFVGLDSLAADYNQTALRFWPDEKQFFTMVIGLGENATKTVLQISSELNRIKGLKIKVKKLLNK